MADPSPLDALAELLDCDRIADAGAAFGQVATRTEWGGLVVASARFVEYGARATTLLVPGLFRADLQPVHETLGVQLRALTAHRVRWEADPGTWDALRHASQAEPLEFRGLVEIPDCPVGVQLRVIMITDSEAGGVYLASRAAIGRAVPAEEAS